MKPRQVKKKISVIIPAYNREKLIFHCLKSIFGTKYPNFEVIVVDDGSTDNTVEVAKTFDCKIIKLKENKGVSYARNIGSKNANGDILYFVDSDIIQEGDNISNIMEKFEKDSELGVIAASLTMQPFNEGFCPSFVALKYFYQTNHVMIKKNLERQEVTFFPTCSVAIKKDIFERTKGFDESLRLGGEDHKLGHKISKRHKIYIYNDIKVIPNLPKLSKRFRLMMKRSAIHVTLFLKHKKFEPVGNATMKEAFLTGLVLLTIISFIVSFFFPIFLVITSFLLLLFLFMRSGFYKFLFEKKNLIFMFKGILADFILYLSRSIGVSFGLLRKPFVKSEQ